MDCEKIEVTQATETETAKQDSEVAKKTFSPGRIKFLIAIIYGNLFLGSCYSLMAPFFPAEAEAKGATPTEYGFVFGVYQLVMFVMSPVYGRLTPILRPGFMMKAGMLVSGICIILFGCLKYCPPGKLFVGLAFAIHTVDAMGASAFLTASYTTLACEFPDMIGRAVSLLETFFACGLAGGPAIGGVLYQVGGFVTPFVVIGTLLLLGSVVNFILFSDTDGGISAPGGSTKQLVMNFDFFLDILVNFSCFLVLGFNEATLEPHMRQFSLSPAAIGGVFLISGILDATTAPVWGYISEKMANCQHLMLVGCILLIICFAIVGPLPFFHLSTTLWMIILSQVLLGLGMAMIFVCTFTHGIKATVERGFPDDVPTYSLVSGVLLSSACLGGFLGPSLGGYLTDTVGYKYATTVICGFELLVILIMVIRFSCQLTRRKQIPDCIKLEPKVEKEKF